MNMWIRLQGDRHGGDNGGQLTKRRGAVCYIIARSQSGFNGHMPTTIEEGLAPLIGAYMKEETGDASLKMI